MREDGWGGLLKKEGWQGREEGQEGKQRRGRPRVLHEWQTNGWKKEDCYNGIEDFFLLARYPVLRTGAFSFTLSIHIQETLISQNIPQSSIQKFKSFPQSPPSPHFSFLLCSLSSAPPQTHLGIISHSNHALSPALLSPSSIIFSNSNDNGRFTLLKRKHSCTTWFNSGE